MGDTCSQCCLLQRSPRARPYPCVKRFDVAHLNLQLGPQHLALAQRRRQRRRTLRIGGGGGRLGLGLQSGVAGPQLLHLHGGNGQQNRHMMGAHGGNDGQGQVASRCLCQPVAERKAI